MHLGDSTKSNNVSLWRSACVAALAVPLIFFFPGAEQQARAQSFTVIHNFSGTEGASPQRGLVLDASGSIYGTTEYGGAANLGTVFKIDAAGNESVLHSFSGTDGALPLATPVRDSAGNLYGTTEAGGAADLGTVFRIDTAGNESVLHNFTALEGGGPYSGLIRDASGNLYGTAYSGGPGSHGMVFRIDSSGNETVLHSFTGDKDDGGGPVGKLLLDASGSLWGTTGYGGSMNDGTVFRIDAQGKESVVYSFTGPDGANPYAGLVMDAAGNLYGTTFQGGSQNLGTVFRIDAAGNETVLHSFSGPDGQYPHADLIFDASGNLYGTTFDGGASGYGTIFKVDAARNYSVLHSFSPADGVRPTGELVLDGAGNLYGTTTAGGSGAGEAGTVFKLSGAVSGFTITPIPGAETVARGMAAAYLLKISSVNGFAGNVKLSCSGGPAGAVCVNLPMTVRVNPVALAIAGIFFPATTAPGTYTITFNGVSGTAASTATATFTVR